MKGHLKKWWPTIVHGAGTLAVFLDPAIQSELSHHKAIAATGLIVWGTFLHWLTSPKNADVVKEAKESGV